MQTYSTTILPDVSAYLTYDPSFMTTDDPNGLWLCTDLEDVQAIQINAATLALGVSVEALRQCKPFFEAFPQVVVCGADEGRRTALCEAVQKALPSVEVCTTSQNAYHGCESIQELRTKYGLSAVEDLQQYVEELDPWGLLEASTIESQDMTQVGHVRSGIKELDRMIGGLYDGELTVWTGKGGEGKSTALALPILTAIRSGRSVCVYSGEMNECRYIDWLRTIAAGPGNTYQKELETGKIIWTAKPEIVESINLWWKNKLHLLNNRREGIHQEDTILSLFQYAHRRYGCTVFVVDNLMTVELPDEDLYRAQSRLVGHLLDFAHETGSHVHLVAHRRKSGGNTKGRGGRTDGDEVSGSSDITKRADNVICVSRIEDPESDYSTKLELVKNRDFGAAGSIEMKFDDCSRRLYRNDPAWKCGWEDDYGGVQQAFQELEPDDSMPF